MTAPAARASAPASASATYVPRREGLEASGLSSAPGSGASLVAVGVPDGEALPGDVSGAVSVGVGLGSGVGDTVVVNGAGPIGQMYIRLAQLRGAFAELEALAQQPASPNISEPQA